MQGEERGHELCVIYLWSFTLLYDIEYKDFCRLCLGFGALSKSVTCDMIGPCSGNKMRYLKSIRLSKKHQRYLEH